MLQVTAGSWASGSDLNYNYGLVRTMNSPKLTQEQEDLAVQLSKYDMRIKDAYMGAIYTLQQEEYPNRLAHFAYSLRDVVDLLARSKQTKESEKMLDRKERKKLLQSVIDPLAKKQTYGYDNEYQILVDECANLSFIAHNKKPITEKQAHEKLTSVEHALRIITVPQTTINETIDKIVMKNPSLKDAKKLTKMQGRVATQLQLLEKLPHRWLPYMIEAGFFKKPNQVSSQYLVKCVAAFPEEVANIILSCTFKDHQHNFIVYTNFLACGLNLPINYLEKIGVKMIEEQWHIFIENYLFAEKYVEVMEILYLNESYDIAVKLAHNTFKPKPNNDTANYEDEPTPMASYWFENLLHDKIPKLAHKNLILLTKLIITLLDEYIRSANWRKNNNDDGSWTWRSIVSIKSFGT